MAHHAITLPVSSHRLTDGQATCHYAELPALIARTDHFLSNQGIEPGDTLGLECLNTLAGAVTLLALLATGRNFFLMSGSGNDNPAKPEQDLKPPAGFCRYRLVVVRDKAMANPVFDPVDYLEVRPNEHFRGPMSAEPADGPSSHLYLRTSGSMGPSRIVVHAHDKLLANAGNCVERFGLESRDRIMIPLPIFHLYGLGAGLLPGILAGAHLCLEDNCNILRYLEAERRFEPDVAFLNPQLCEMLLRFRRRDTRYRKVITSTQRMPEDLFFRFEARFGTLVSLYGSTEMGAVAAHRFDAPLEQRVSSLGPPMSAVDLRRASSEAVSELLCQHPCGYMGYVDDNGQWLHRAVANEAYHTGELVAVDANGHYTVNGRVNDSVNRSGYLIYLSDVEKMMESLPEIRQVVVVASDQADTHHRGSILVAFCTIEPGFEDIQASDLRSRCFNLLPRHSIPDRIVLSARIPLLPSGKVDRQALRQQARLPLPG